MLINASKLFEKGTPKNFLPESAFKKITGIYQNYKEEEGVSKMLTTEESAESDYNNNPSRYIIQNDEEDTLPLEEAMVLVKKAEEELSISDTTLKNVLTDLGLV